MKPTAGIAAVLTGLFAAFGAAAQSAASSRAVADMYAEATRLGVSVEEAERALQPTAALRAPRDVTAGLESIVGGWANAAAGASAAPAKAQLRR
jgi:hypothetical protein